MPKTPTKLSSLIKARYQVRDNTFIRAAKDDPRDRVDIEIGDEKQPSTFYPQVKIKRWDNECNFSCRLKDNDYDTPTIQTSQDKIKWISGKREAHFYEIGASEEHPEGAYEFEVVLKEKPATNVVEFSIQTKGLEFFYQPALTQEEIEQGAFRPENVVGSYAAYYKDCPANYEGGKLYRVGKAFHIYRPKIEDAKGNWTWGELQVDEEQGTLAVTIPWEFLDKAVYPVRHAAGLTFGYTTSGSSSTGIEADYIFSLELASPSSSGSLDSMTFRADSQTSYQQLIKGALYKDSDLSLIDTTVETNIGNTGWTNWTASFNTGASVIAGTNYHLCLWWDQYNVALAYDATTITRPRKTLTYDGNYPNPISWTTADYAFTRNRRFTIYCTYTASASSKIKKFMGIEQAKLKKISGIAIASVKKLVGVANT